MAKTLRDLLREYDELTEWWSELSEAAANDGVAESVADCRHYSEGLEELAHEFAAWVKRNGMNHGATLDWKV